MFFGLKLQVKEGLHKTTKGTRSAPDISHVQFLWCCDRRHAC